MKIGVYGDVHITKNMRTLQDKWEESVNKSIHYMYNQFDELEVESVVCLGDFFDAPRLEAKHIHLVLPILEEINSKTYPTYILLGNHEMDSETSNILDYLNNYDNIIPVTEPKLYENMFFIPYGIDPSTLSFKDEYIIFTHHDIYGSDLASGKSKAFFGIAPSVFEGVRLVMNGHVHLKSQVTNNIMNAGSLLCSQQGELRVGDYPSYYLVDTKTVDITPFSNVYSMVYLSIDEKEIQEVLKYDRNNLILRVEYENEIKKDLKDSFPHIVCRKKISSIGKTDEKSVHLHNFDMKNYLTEFIKKDIDVSDDKKDVYVSVGLELLQ